jgi:hypothetical protein
MPLGCERVNDRADRIRQPRHLFGAVGHLLDG